MRGMRLACRALLAATVVLLPAPTAQWNPASGLWGKSDPADIRVMTWNVKDGIASRRTKQATGSQWEALARVVAALEPDVLLLQEAGDNPSGGVDSVSVLRQVCRLFFTGGNDPYLGGTVGAFVQRYAPGYDLPFVFVSGITDGFNRNVLLSRFPFGDLNGDGNSRLSDIPPMQAHLYQNGGNGGIRGFQFAELQLDDGVYRGDLVVGNAHLKAGSSSADARQRRIAAQNTAYIVDYWWQGGGLGQGPDPFNVIFDSPPATKLLDDDTPVVLGGDWNEDALGGSRAPAEWLTQAAVAGGTDGTDRDRSDMRYDGGTHWFTRSRATIGSVKFDYVAWQDSVCSARLQFVFDTAGTPQAALPPEVLGFPSVAGLSAVASDHRPVVVDLRLPLVDCQEDLGFGGPGAAQLSICGGPLLPGRTATLQVSGAPPLAALLVAVSPSQTPTPLLGGTIVPWPSPAILAAQINIAGSFLLPLSGNGGPIDLFVQAVYADASLPTGLGFTNAVRARWRR